MATSNDGINWIKYEQNPIINLGSSGEWDDTNIYSGPVLYDSSGFKMWYTGYSGDIERIGLATSEDGMHWEKYAGNPVLDIGEPEQWDDEHVTLGSVIYQDSLYKMWYAGWGRETWSFGYATSPDGITWTRYEENPVLELADYDEWFVENDDDKLHGYVIFNGVSYEMWFKGNMIPYGVQTGYASSPDGLTWDIYEHNPILGGDVGSVLLKDGAYHMWYQYSSAGIGYAEDFSHNAHTDTFTLNSSFARPAIDTLVINAMINNPQENDITVQAMIEDADSVWIDSIQLDNQGDGLWQGWTIPEGERMYQVWIKTIDEQAGTIHNGNFWQYGHFCTIGPIVFDSYEVVGADTIPDAGARLRYRINLRNEGKLATAEDVSIKVTSLDTFTTLTIFQDPVYGNIAPGEIAEPDRAIMVEIADDCPDKYAIKFKIDIYSGSSLFWTAEYDVITNIADDLARVPYLFELNQNYPNPFNPTTTISYQLSAVSDVELGVYNLTGQKVATLVSKNQHTGHYQVEWDASGFASGVYYYRLEAGEFLAVKKMILLR
jgi:hypothetical protein